MITVSAPGKIHLLGEHVVVYGKPAILAAVDKRVYVKIKSEKNAMINTQEDDYLIKQAILVFKKAFSIEKLPQFEIIITSNLPSSSGLGSSSAVAAATIGALMRFIKKRWDPIQIDKLTYKVEKIAHGNPSGADNAVVVMGGLVWFRREFDFLKSICNLPIYSYKIPPFVLINTGKPKETTREMVELVECLYQADRRKMEKVFSSQEEQTKRLLLALKEGNEDELKRAIKKGERNLEKIGVVGIFAKKIIREIEKIGGVAKISGAGGRKKGSGILLCYHKDLSQIKAVGEKYKLSAYEVLLGEEGVRTEGSLKRKVQSF